MSHPVLLNQLLLVWIAFVPICLNMHYIQQRLSYICATKYGILALCYTYDSPDVIPISTKSQHLIFLTVMSFSPKHHNLKKLSMHASPMKSKQESWYHHNDWAWFSNVSEHHDICHNCSYFHIFLPKFFLDLFQSCIRFYQNHRKISSQYF